MKIAVLTGSLFGLGKLRSIANVARVAACPVDVAAAVDVHSTKRKNRKI